MATQQCDLTLHLEFETYNPRRDTGWTVTMLKEWIEELVKRLNDPGTGAVWLWDATEVVEREPILRG